METKKQRSHKVYPTPTSTQSGHTPITSSQPNQQEQKLVSTVDHSCKSSSSKRHPNNTESDTTKCHDLQTYKPSSRSNSIRSIVNDEIDLLLIGKTGNGKSALGNSILDYEAFVSEPSATSVTKEVCDEAIAINPEGYHAFLLVVKFGGRFTKEDKGTVDFLKEVFGQTFVSKFCILVLTYGDQFEAQVKDKFKDWIQSQKGVLSDLVKECNNRVILFDNQTTDRQKRKRQVNELIEIVDSLKQENSRYTNDQFDLAKSERESLELTSQAPLIIDAAMTEADVIFKKFKRIQESVKTNYDPAPLEPLLERINTLYKSIILKDNKTGVLGDLLIHIAALRSTITDEVNICDRLSKLEKNMKQTYASQLEKMSVKLSEAKLNFDHLSQERKKLEQINIHKLQKEIQKLEREKDELEKDKLAISLKFNEKTKEIRYLYEQNKKMKEKHRENILSSMAHKIAKTFTKKTKDRPPEKENATKPVGHVLY
ncbi:GTPase IMAP family member [Biomphalaria glabrata]|nr:GTPase IMAP family member [Biomphalaria glabrata]